MKKYLWIISVIIILSIALLTQPVQRTLGLVQPYQSPLETILDSSGGKFYEVRVLAWGKVNEKFMTVQDIKKLLADIGKTYYNTLSVPKFHIEENYKAGEIIAEVMPHRSLHVSLQTYCPQIKTPDLPSESYLLVELAQSDQNFTLDELKKQVASIYHKLDVTPQTTLTYTAKLRGKITLTQVDDIFEKTKIVLALKNIQEVKTTGFYSLTGFSDVFPDEIVIAGVKRNFTLTTRYSIADDETYIIFGTPDLGGEE